MSFVALEHASQLPAKGSCSPSRGKTSRITWSDIVNADGVGGVVRKELDAQLRALNITPSKEDEDVTWAERWTYRVEKFMSYSDGALFYLLFVILMFLVLVLGSIWYWKQGIHDPFSSQNGRRMRAGGANDADDTEDAESQVYEFTFVQSLFIAFQVILSAGYDETIEGVVSMLIYSTMILVGLIVLGLLIGMITESFESLVEKIRSGELKAVEKNHTLVLGWNEGTVRLVCQLAFLRRQWLQMNESWERTIFPWRRVPPSTIVARGTIVVMCNTKSKAEMEQAISHAFAERGISKRRTRLGCDVVCRSGNPSDVQDLQRVGAQHAVAIVIHAQDGVELRVAHGTTLRSLMALRFVLYTAHVPPPWEHLRIVVEMSQPSKVVDTAAFSCPHSDRPVVHVQDMGIFLNGLLFACLGQPGLAQVQLDLMCFETAAIKFRRAREFYYKFSSLKGATVADAMLLWEDAVLVGVRKHAAGKSGTELDGVRSRLSQSGLLPDPSDVIEPEDTVLFLCRSSMPQPSKAQLEEDDSDDANHGLSMDHRRSSNESSVVAVLICGWRFEWDSQPGAFLNTLREIATARHFGTTMRLHFLCRKSPDDFREFMAGVVRKEEEIVDSKETGGSNWSQQMTNKSKLKKNVRQSEDKPEWFFDDTIGITHTCGDAEKLDDLEGVIKAHMKANIQFNEAIVLPPRCRDEGEGDAFDKLSQDTWVMSVMLMLRHFQKELNITPMHVITENALDATSKLAMAPSSEGRPIYPDFVNSHAIRARALCQVLAYPEMGPVLKELYSKDSGCPNLMLIKAGYFGLTDQKLTFRQVTRRVKAKLARQGKPARDVCLGWQTASGKLEMPPMQSDECQFCHGDKLIIITDRATSAEQYETDLIEPDQGMDDVLQ